MLPIITIQLTPDEAKVATYALNQAKRVTGMHITQHAKDSKWDASLDTVIGKFENPYPNTSPEISDDEGLHHDELIEADETDEE
jgi:hypothetical protein